MPRGLHSFIVLSCGQFVSTFGSGLSRFAMAVWIYQETGQATQYGLALFFSWLPELLFSPVAGALVDRWDRRWAMILSDTGLALVTAAIALLLMFDRLEVWHVYASGVVGSLFGSFQFPAYSASVTLLVPKQLLGKASGVAQLSSSTSNVLAPVCAIGLIGVVGIHGVLLIDCVTFVAAIVTLAIIHIPRPEPSSQDEATDGGGSSLVQEVKAGGSFIFARPGLVFLLLFLGFINLCVGFHTTLLPSLLLGVASVTALGTVSAASSAGMLAGSLVMTLTGGPRRKMAAILGFGGMYTVGLGAIGVTPTLPLIAAAAFAAFFSVPLVNGCSQVIWQRKVPPGMQGRVFAVRRMTAQATLPLAFLVAGPLADRVFNPLLAEGGALVASLGPWMGTGPGRGAGLLYLILAVLGALATLRAWLSPRLRGVEEELPDFV